MVLLLPQGAFLIFQFGQLLDGGLESCLVAGPKLLKLLYHLALVYHFLLLLSLQQQYVSVNHVIELVIEFLDSVADLFVLSDKFIHVELLKYTFLVIWTVLLRDGCEFVWGFLLLLL